MTNAAPDDAPVVPQYFHYETPQFDSVCASRRLGTTDYAFMNVQIIREGGESTLHSHQISDGFWMVLNGRVRFYTTNDELVADLGPLEGIVVPRGYPYWFEKAGDDQVELLQFEALSRPMRSKEAIRATRIDHVPRTHERGRADVADLSRPIAV